jgi:hypothetical protein
MPKLTMIPQNLFSPQESSNTVNTVLELLQSLMPSILENYQKTSACGSTARAQKALHELHIQPKTTETSDQLMVNTVDPKFVSQFW